MKHNKLTPAQKGARGGRSTSPRKRRASRSNGTRGGRPSWWACPECPSGAAGRALQITYRDGERVKITCRLCGASGEPQSALWLTPEGAKHITP